MTTDRDELTTTFNLIAEIAALPTEDVFGIIGRMLRSPQAQALARQALDEHDAQPHDAYAQTQGVTQAKGDDDGPGAQRSAQPA